MTPWAGLGYATRMAAFSLPTLPREDWLGDLSRRNYRTALYVLLALPLGGLIVSMIVGGTLLGILSLPLLVGLGLLLGVLWLIHGLAGVQRYFAQLLDIRFMEVVPQPAYNGVLPWLRATLANPMTYRLLMFHVVQLPLAALSWVVLGSLLGLGLLGVTAPGWATDANVLPILVGSRISFSPLGAWGLVVVGLGALYLAHSVLNVLGRVWSWLAFALLSEPLPHNAALREVAALRRAAGRVALGDDLQRTLADLLEQALAASNAQGVALGTLSGARLAQQGATFDLQALSPPLGSADVRLTPGRATLATLTVSAGGQVAGTLQALYAPGTQPSPDELAFLLSIADHAGTALHAAELIGRATERAGEAERARLARELHDSVAQALYGISLGAKTARATLEADPHKAQASLDYTIRLAEGGVSEMKALLFSLRPDALEEGGLVAALTQNAHALEARHGLKVHTDWQREPPLSPQAQAAAYRILQEALHNVVKHARAHSVWLSVTETEGQVRLQIRDDGRGFDPLAVRGGTLGQRSMRERAAGVGGELTVDSGAAGTTVTLTLRAEAQA